MIHITPNDDFFEKAGQTFIILLPLINQPLSLLTYLSSFLTNTKISTKYFLSKALDNHTFRDKNISSIEKQPCFGYFAVKLASNLIGSFRPAIITAFNPVILIK